METNRYVRTRSDCSFVTATPTRAWWTVSDVAGATPNLDVATISTVKSSATPHAHSSDVALSSANVRPYASA
jgi:hypothetical protein